MTTRLSTGLRSALQSARAPQSATVEPSQPHSGDPKQRGNLGMSRPSRTAAHTCSRRSRAPEVLVVLEILVQWRPPNTEYSQRTDNCPGQAGCDSR